MEVIVDTTKGIYREHIVRCRDCKNYDGGEVAHEYERCRHHWSEVGEDDFCSFGEREDNGKDIQSATE